MSPEERFILFVSVFIKYVSTIDQIRNQILEDAYKALGTQGVPPEPIMHAAHEFVQYKLTGAHRPAWLPPR